MRKLLNCSLLLALICCLINISSAHAGPADWPKSISDFKFPFNGVYNNYWSGEIWTIANAYGSGKHTCKYASCYPNAGYYSIDLIRSGGPTAGGAVLASAAGVVKELGKMNGYGWYVIMDHGNGYTSIVAHLNCDPKRFVHVDDNLLQGTLIGVAGSSGTNVAHIHFSVWKNNVSVSLNGISGGANIVKNGLYCSGNEYVRAPTGALNCP